MFVSKDVIALILQQATSHRLTFGSDVFTPLATGCRVRRSWGWRLDIAAALLKHVQALIIHMTNAAELHYLAA